MLELGQLSKRIGRTNADIGFPSANRFVESSDTSITSYNVYKMKCADGPSLTVYVSAEPEDADFDDELFVRRVALLPRLV